MNQSATTAIAWTLLLFPTICFGQLSNSEILESNAKFREEINHDYADSTKSPLTKEDFSKFSGLPFFSVDTNFCLEAKFKLSKRKKSFKMKTTTDRRPIYDVYGSATFLIDGNEYSLNIYQSHQLKDTEEFKNYLFVPFKDLSNGGESYGGGRFIDLSIPEGNTIIIDFNQSYNPYCAYSTRYSCPIPPKENFLNIKVLAGVKSPH
jgi:uncharacterized protein (DUF1684 family)